MDTNRTYSVYTHKVVTDDKGPMWYVGVTKNVKQRWHTSAYCQTSLEPYINKYGWENIEHRVVANRLDKETAYKMEDVLILMYRSADCCINNQRSGMITENKESYTKKWQKEHRKEHLERKKIHYRLHKDEYSAYSKNYRNTHQEELKASKKKYYENNKDKCKAHQKEYRSTIEQKIYERVKTFNRYHPDRTTETPLEAKRKYLSTGYIPDYIKNYDLIKENNNNNNV